MTMDLLSDLGRFTPPVSAEDFGFDNLFSSNPAYDEASGPERDDRYFDVDEFGDEEWTEEDEEEYWNRLLFQDPNEPLGPGETKASVLASMRDTRLLITVPVGYQPPLCPVQKAIRKFKCAPARTEVVTVTKFDKAARQRVPCRKVAVTVRRLKAMVPH